MYIYIYIYIYIFDADWFLDQITVRNVKRFQQRFALTHQSLSLFKK